MCGMFWSVFFLHLQCIKVSRIADTGNTSCCLFDSCSSFKRLHQSWKFDGSHWIWNVKSTESQKKTFFQTFTVFSVWKNILPNRFSLDRLCRNIFVNIPNYQIMGNNEAQSCKQFKQSVDSMFKCNDVNVMSNKVRWNYLISRCAYFTWLFSSKLSSAQIKTF